MSSMKEITCKCGCGMKKMVRTADIKRGWGKFYSKSCKATHQERRTGQMARHISRRDYVYQQSDHDYAISAMEDGWDGHKNSF